MLHQLPSNQRFARLAKESFLVTTRSNNTGGRKEHGAKQRKLSETVADLDKIVEEEGDDGEKLEEELSACQHFLVDTELENGRNKVLKFRMSKLDIKIINEKL